MRRRCKHENADHLKPGDHFNPNGKPFNSRTLTFEIFVCLDCNELLPLGEARDTPETTVELRAAELAHGVDNEADFASCEWMGWNGDEVYSTSPGLTYHTIDKLPLRNLREWHAGYLARVIVEHASLPPPPRGGV